MRRNSVIVRSVVFVMRLWLWIFDIITFPIYYFLQQIRETPRAPQRKVTIAYRTDKEILLETESSQTEIMQTIHKENIATIADVLIYIHKLHPNLPLLGTREVLAKEDVRQPDGKIFQKYVLGEYKWLGFQDALLQCSQVGKGLRALGLNRGDKVVIFSETRAEWILSAFGCFLEGISVVTLYATLGNDAVSHGINETEVTCMFSCASLLPKLKEILKNTPKIRHLIVFENEVEKLSRSVESAEGVKMVSFSDLLTSGQTVSFERNLPKQDDVAVIMYTSGSTGVPKGVELSHKNLLTACYSLENYIQVSNSDMYIGYLPLAHVMELCAELYFFFKAVPIGYSNPQTLITGAPGLKKGYLGDINILHPTIFVTVPLILNRIYKKIHQRMKNKGEIPLAIFEMTICYKEWWLKHGFNTPLLNAIMFRRSRKLFGHRIRIIICGGASLAKDIQSFARSVLCCPLLVGYGITENTGAGTIMLMNDIGLGTVGPPLSACKFKLINWTEGGYSVCDIPNPRGEIVIGGDSVAIGYFKNPELSKEVFYEKDGVRWFYTGDIGEMWPDGKLSIIDRKKDLVKLQHGEYISLGKVETALMKSQYIDHICVCADPNSDHTVALISPSVDDVTQLAVRLGKDSMTFEDLLNDKEIIREVYNDLRDWAKKASLESAEIPRSISLCKHKWTTENGLVTAGLKLRRRNIHAKYKDEIDRLYRIEN